MTVYYVVKVFATLFAIASELSCLFNQMVSVSDL